MNKEELKSAISEAMQESMALSEKCYPQSHKLFVETWMEKEKRKQELWADYFNPALR